MATNYNYSTDRKGDLWHNFPLLVMSRLTDCQCFISLPHRPYYFIISHGHSLNSLWRQTRVDRNRLNYCLFHVIHVGQGQISHVTLIGLDQIFKIKITIAVTRLGTTIILEALNLNLLFQYGKENLKRKELFVSNQAASVHHYVVMTKHRNILGRAGWQGGVYICLYAPLGAFCL